MLKTALWHAFHLTSSLLVCEKNHSKPSFCNWFIFLLFKYVLNMAVFKCKIVKMRDFYVVHSCLQGGNVLPLG